jgi:hypothetical protein
MKFEYKQIVLDLGIMLGQKKADAALEILNENGRDGWELVSAAGIGEAHWMVYVFKKPLRSEF